MKKLLLMVPVLLLVAVLLTPAQQQIGSPAGEGSNTLYSWGPFQGATTGNVGMTANTIRVYAIPNWASTPVIFSAIDIYVSTADTTSGDVYSFGIYGPCTPGVAICTVAASNAAVAFSSVGFLELTPSQTTPIIGYPTIAPGQFYYVAWTGNASTAQINDAPGRYFTPVCDALSSTSSSGGALPSSIAIPSASWGVCGTTPIFNIHD